MNQFNQTFYIYKTSYIKDEVPDVGFLPMLMRRKLSSIGKTAIYTMNEVYEGNDIKLVYASNYGELERVKKLLDQKNTEGEMSPTGFSFSVHNSSVGLFSLLNKINSPYSSISAGENSLSAGILESVITNDDVLFCFAESVVGLRGAACTFGRKPRVGAIKAELLPNDGKTSAAGFDDFVNFLNGAKDEYVSDFYVLRRYNG